MLKIDFLSLALIEDQTEHLGQSTSVYKCTPFTECPDCRHTLRDGKTVKNRQKRVACHLATRIPILVSSQMLLAPIFATIVVAAHIACGIAGNVTTSTPGLSYNDSSSLAKRQTITYDPSPDCIVGYCTGGVVDHCTICGIGRFYGCLHPPLNFIQILALLLLQLLLSL
jgi:hypothetical protein